MRGTNTIKFARVASMLRLQRIVAALQSGPKSCAQLQAIVHGSDTTVLSYVRFLRAEKKVRIAAWRKNSSGAGELVRLYGLGSKPDAKRPAPKTDREVERAYRQKLRQDPERLMRHYETCNKRRRQATPKPTGIFRLWASKPPSALPGAST